MRRRGAVADEQVDVAESSKAIQAFGFQFTAVGEQDAFVRLRPCAFFYREGAAKAAQWLRALANEHRLLVLCLLLEADEMSVGELQARIALSQSALSQHLARMREEGLIAFRREAQTLYYRIEHPEVARLMATLKTLFCPDKPPEETA